MPSPYDLIQQAKLKKKREDGNKRADKWTATQANTAQEVQAVDLPVQTSVPTRPPFPPPTSPSRRASIDAINKRHGQALKNANWKTVDED